MKRPTTRLVGHFATSFKNERVFPGLLPVIKSIVTGGSVGVKVNDELGYFFQTKKGLRQGILFHRFSLTLT